ncbi:hypothetical protein [Niabella hibiscisoli]|uniref:hypothetical protein n=1 Tax=Niabella hibiscisoli TaxID=1825928 RepID=UPI001F10482B|nr:hypothetical protein [Niabella hibiscisoli]MCH5717319.1 hypothetical protein [Niabella hibiscisoli]
MLFIFLVSASWLLSCNNSSNLGKSSDEKDAVVDPVMVRDSVVIVDSITSMDTASAIMPAETVIQVQIPAETLPVTRLPKTLTSDQQSIHVTITDLEVGQLRISINHSKPDVNIRISQVIRPDGSMDGPFGQQLVYDIKQRGNYTVIINKSNMASGSQVGDVFITMER